MTTTSSTVEHLHKYLDENPDDFTARLVLADAVEEAGGDGAGWRASATLGKRATKFANTYWWSNLLYAPLGEFGVRKSERLPPDWLYLLVSTHTSNISWDTKTVHFDTRYEAEVAAATAFTSLPPDRQAQLLRGEL